MRNLGSSGSCLCITKNLEKLFEKGFLPERERTLLEGLKQLFGNTFQKLCHLTEQRMNFCMSFSERYYLNIMYFGSDANFLWAPSLHYFSRMIELSAPAGYGVK